MKRLTIERTNEKALNSVIFLKKTKIIAQFRVDQSFNENLTYMLCYDVKRFSSELLSWQMVHLLNGLKFNVVRQRKPQRKKQKYLVNKNVHFQNME